MAQRNYSKDTNSSPAERKRQDKAKRPDPAGSSIPSNLPALETFNTLKLETEQYAAKSLRNNVNTNFSEFAKPPIDEDIEQFFQIYREIFYDIPKKGEQSHTKLLEDSKDYIEDYVDPKDTTITTLLNKVEALQEQIQEEFQTQSHPFYPDGSIMHVPYVSIGIMQNGLYRRISWNVWLTWREANPNFKNADGSDKSNKEIMYLFEDESFLNTMKKGQRINHLDDFNDYNIAEPTDVLNFNSLKNSMESQRLDQAEIEILRQLLDRIAETAPDAGTSSNNVLSNRTNANFVSAPSQTSYSRG